MELRQRDFMIFYEFQQGLTQKQHSDRMKSTFDIEVRSKVMIYNWFKNFSRSHKILSEHV